MSNQHITPTSIKTSIIIISDTCGMKFPGIPEDLGPFDLLIHCGNMTMNSGTADLLKTVQLLKIFRATVKLVIAGGRDFSLDPPVFESISRNRRLRGPLPPYEICDPALAQSALQRAKEDSIYFLEEGTYRFALPNGAKFKVFASPYTPNDGTKWAFQYKEPRQWAIEPDTDIVMTHGPPHGVIDCSYELQRIGSASLRIAVAEVRPKLHCFGQSRWQWGAGIATWDDENGKRSPYFSWKLIASLFWPDENNTARASYNAELNSNQTLFVNATIRGEELAQSPARRPWVVRIRLPPRDPSMRDGLQMDHA